MNIFKQRIESQVNVIIENRGKKIKDVEKVKKELENGEIYTAKEALERGLIDEIIEPDEFVRREFKDSRLELFKLSQWQML